MKAILRKVSISPAKANLVAGIVVGKKVPIALAMLRNIPKKAAHILYKVVHSAASNAKTNFGQPWEELVVTKIMVNKGATLKRGLFVSRGRHHPILKRTCHITVEVGVPGAAPAKVVKKAAKAETALKEERSSPKAKAAKPAAPARAEAKKAPKAKETKKSKKA